MSESSTTRTRGLLSSLSFKELVICLFSFHSETTRFLEDLAIYINRSAFATDTSLVSVIETTAPIEIDNCSLL